MLSILIYRTTKSILTFSGVNKRRKIEKNHETSPCRTIKLPFTPLNVLGEA